MNNSRENLEAPRSFFVLVYLKINELLLLYMYKKRDDKHELVQYKNYKRKNRRFLKLN